MHAASRPPTRLRAFLVAILIAAMLCSHWQGLAHRIEHASRMFGGAGLIAALQDDAAPPQASATAAAQPAAAVNALSAPLSEHQGAGHSCLAFDAATVGAFLCSAAFVVDLQRIAPPLPAWLAFISYLAPLTPHFSSRAPPQS